MEYLNLFNNEAAYNAAKDNLELPSVSYAEGENKVFYNPYIDPANGYEYVDLGLSVKWATCNIGAAKPEEDGLYFAWGDTEGHTSNTSDGRVFNWASAPFNNGSGSYDTSYFASVSATTCPNGVLAPEYDAAVQNLGGKWRMPTHEEWVELANNTTATWTQVNGINGRRFTASNGNSIFIPASGFRRGSSLVFQGSCGGYWSSSLRVDYPDNAWYVDFTSDYQGPDDRSFRCNGFCVRPVLGI